MAVHAVQKAEQDRLFNRIASKGLCRVRAHFRPALDERHRIENEGLDC
jgi:hypothetical protein